MLDAHKEKDQVDDCWHLATHELTCVNAQLKIDDLVVYMMYVRRRLERRRCWHLDDDTQVNICCCLLVWGTAAERGVNAWHKLILYVSWLKLIVDKTDAQIVVARSTRQ